MIIELDGEKISTEAEFHNHLAKLLNIENFYGYNLDALWDLLGTSVERPIKIIWKNSQISKQNMQKSFDDVFYLYETGLTARDKEDIDIHRWVYEEEPEDLDNPYYQEEQLVCGICFGTNYRASLVEAPKQIIEYISVHDWSLQRS